MQLHYINGEPTSETRAYLEMKERLRELEKELGLEPMGIYKLPWKDVQALHRMGNIDKNSMEHIYIRKKLYDTSLYNTELCGDKIVERGLRGYDLAKTIRRML